MVGTGFIRAYKAHAAGVESGFFLPAGSAIMAALAQKVCVGKKGFRACFLMPRKSFKQ